MHPHNGGESAETIKQEQDVITQHRKRKKVDDAPTLTIESALTDESGFANAVQRTLGKSVRFPFLDSLKSNATIKMCLWDSHCILCVRA